jgi:hypothetical protein
LPERTGALTRVRSQNFLTHSTFQISECDAHGRPVFNRRPVTLSQRTLPSTTADTSAVDFRWRTWSVVAARPASRLAPAAGIRIETRIDKRSIACRANLRRPSYESAGVRGEGLSRSTDVFATSTAPGALDAQFFGTQRNMAHTSNWRMSRSPSGQERRYSKPTLTRSRPGPRRQAWPVRVSRRSAVSVVQ